MEDLFRDYWWLMFPIGGFAFAAFGMAMGARMQRERMAVLRTYAEKGMTPPPELVREVAGHEDAGAVSRRERRRYRRMRYGRGSFVVPAILAAVFFSVAYYGDGFLWGPFMIVAIVMAAVAVGSLVAEMAGAFGPRRP